MRQSVRTVGSRPEKIHALTSLRFFAAFYVVLFHTLDQPFHKEIADTWVQHFISLGYIAVSFFFLLSGYILAIVYLRDGKPLNKGAFYTARFARVYPLFLLTLLADLPFVLNQRANEYGWQTALEKTAFTLGAHLLMLQAWLPNIHGIDQPNWSLSVETLFYLLFPFIGIAVWTLKGFRVWLTALVIWTVSQVVVTLASPHLSITTAKFHPLLHVGTFTLGILLARWQRLQKKRSSTPHIFVTLALLLVSLSLAAVIHWENFLPLPNLNAGLLAPVFAVMIWACSTGTVPLMRFLSSPPLVLLGEASFSLYLIHMPVNHMFEALHWENSKPLYPVYLGLCVGLSIASFYWIETPIRKWLLQQLHTQPKETMETASDVQ